MVFDLSLIESLNVICWISFDSVTFAVKLSVMGLFISSRISYDFDFSPSFLIELRNVFVPWQVFRSYACDLKKSRLNLTSILVELRFFLKERKLKLTIVKKCYSL